jgi:hypothetical protein
MGTALLLVGRHVHLPHRYVGWRLHFGDGTAATEYRGTIVDRRRTADSGVLVVCFRLRVINRAVGHALFRWKRLPNTPLFVGLPRFVSKLWIAHDSDGFYRGWYEWDGAAQAEDYVRALWWVLALVSVPGSINYRILPGLRRDEHQADPVRLYPAVTCGNREWSRLTAVENLLP